MIFWLGTLVGQVIIRFPIFFMNFNLFLEYCSSVVLISSILIFIHALSAIIMTPTRELAMQITSECKKFTKPLGLKAVCVYGGTGISEQIAELKRGCEIIVCTPGRMIDMLSANNGRCPEWSLIIVSVVVSYACIRNEKLY